GLETITLEIRRAQDFAPAFEALKSRADALYVCTDALTNTHRIRINIAALGERLPTMHGSRDFVEVGGLDVLWTKLSGYVPADRRLCGQDSARGKAGRPPGRAADQIRSGREPDDRESAPPRRAADAVHAHRRGDRMSNCVVGSGGSRLPCSTIAEHRVEGCDHFSHDGHDDDLGFFVGGDEAIVEGFEGGTVTACTEGGHVKDVTDRHPTTIDAAVSLELSAVEVIWCEADEGGDLFAAHLPEFWQQGD